MMERYLGGNMVLELEQILQQAPDNCARGWRLITPDVRTQKALRCAPEMGVAAQAVLKELTALFPEGVFSVMVITDPDSEIEHLNIQVKTGGERKVAQQILDDLYVSGLPEAARVIEDSIVLVLA